MAKNTVMAITGLTISHSHSETDEPRDENGILQEAWFRYSWTNGSQTYSHILITYTGWDPAKKKWDPKCTIELPGDATSWDYDILSTGWTPDTGSYTPKITVSVTPYEVFFGALKKGKSTKHTFTFTNSGKVILPKIDYRLNDSVENRLEFYWTFDEETLTEKEKKIYNNTIIYRSKFQKNLVVPETVQNAKDAFNKKNYPSQEYSYGGVSGSSAGPEPITLYTQVNGLEDFDWSNSVTLRLDEFPASIEGFEFYSVEYTRLIRESVAYFVDLDNWQVIVDPLDREYYGPIYMKYPVVGFEGQASYFGYFRVAYDTLNGSTAKDGGKGYSVVLKDNSGPYTPVINESKSDINLTKVTLVYSVFADNKHGVNEVDVEKCFGVPSGLDPNKKDTKFDSLLLPEEQTWEFVKTIIPKNKFSNNSNKKEVIQLPAGPGVDQAAWIRLVAKNGSNKVPSKPVCIGALRLSTPHLNSLVPDKQIHKVFASIQNTSVFPGVKVAILENTGAATMSLYNLSVDDDDGQGNWVQTVGYRPPEQKETESGTTEEQKVQFGFKAYFGPSWNSGGVVSDVDGWYDEDVVKTTPLANVKVYPSDKVPGSIVVEWESTWAGADGAEISWADHEDAWQSNEGANTASYNYAETPFLQGDVVKLQKPQFYLRGLTAGKWYIRVRATKGGSEYSPYMEADQWPFNYASTPGASALDADPNNISKDPATSFQASWAYENTDNSTQQSATIYELIPKENDPNDFDSVMIAQIEGEDTSTTISPWAPDEQGGAIEGITTYNAIRPCFEGWEEGTEHILVVQSLSSADILSPDPVQAYKNDNKIGCVISINERPIPPELDPLNATDIFALGFNNGQIVEMPLFIKLVDFNNGREDIVAPTDSIKLTISRMRELVSPNRPDNSSNDGFENETIYSTFIMGSDLTDYTDPDTDIQYTGGILITNSDIVGHLDDGCYYDISLTITNVNKLSATANVAGGVKVNWNRQAATPLRLDIQRIDVEDDNGNLTGDIRLRLTPIPSENVDSESVFDIYRLTVDQPKLIVQGGTYGSSYIDPYPSIGVGYRVVDRTKNNDWIEGNETTGGKPAWIDVYAEDKGIDISFYGLFINFGDEFLRLPFNVKLSHKWQKDFQTTKYLNGKVVGDWNAGVLRTITANSDFMKEVTDDMRNVDLEHVFDDDTVQRIRDLAGYVGICNVRSMDGVSVSCDVQVSSEEVSFHQDLNSYSFEISVVEPEDLDGYEDI